jgi:hypothetical protein
MMVTTIMAKPVTMFNVSMGLNSLMKQLKANRRISNIEPQNVEGWNRSPRRRRYNPYEPEATLSHFFIK